MFRLESSLTNLGAQFLYEKSTSVAQSGGSGVTVWTAESNGVLRWGSCWTLHRGYHLVEVELEPNPKFGVYMIYTYVIC